MRVDPKMRTVVDFALSRGWEVSRTNKNHLRFTAKGRKTVFGSGTPSEARASLNIIGKLKRAEQCSM